jgi:hypothetical protein
MVTITSQPDLVSFAGCPVLFTARTSLSDKTFLTVRMIASVSLIVNGVVSVQNDFELSAPTSGGGAEVTFDLSSALTAMFYYHAFGPCYKNSEAVRTPGVVSFTVKLWDEYLDDDNSVVTSNKVTAPSTFGAVPGALSDVQRYMWSVNGTNWMSHKVLSSKPDNEVIPVDFPLLLPLYAFLPQAGDSVTVKLSGTSGVSFSESAPVFYTREPRWVTCSFSKTGSMEITPSTCSPVIVNVVESQPYAMYFEFVNRYGCLESIVCYGRPSLSATQESERLSRVPGRSFRPSSQFMKRLSSYEQSYSLSTGPLSVEWAKWFADEFFRATHVWMFDKTMNCMVPVVIESEDETVIFSNEEPGVIDLSFTAVLGYSGFITGSHM